MPPLMMKSAIPVSLTPTLSRREREQTNRYASFSLRQALVQRLQVIYL